MHHITRHGGQSIYSEQFKPDCNADAKYHLDTDPQRRASSNANTETSGDDSHGTSSDCQHLRRAH